jgi:signal transduction histidine kinase
MGCPMGDAGDNPFTPTARAAWASFAIVLVAFGSAWLAFRDYAPPLHMAWWRGCAAVTVAVFFAAALTFQLSPPKIRADHRLWSRIGETLHWTVWLLVQGVVWLLMPWGTVPLQITTLLFSTGYMAANFLTSFDAPLLGRVRIFTVALSLTLATIIYRVHLWPYLAAYLLCFSIVMMMLAGIIDESIMRLRLARADAEAARDARTQFMAAASHDLGQPLQAARLFFEQAVASGDAARRSAAERNTRSALGAMERLIHQMLDHLRLGEGVVEARIEAFEAGAMIARVAGQFVPLADLSGVAITALPSRLQACGDPALVERALGNLVDNALRHSRATRVVVGARRRGRLVRLYVVDNGHGIAAGEEARLFDAFVQGHEDGQPRTGLGIGLSSVRGLMALMHGATGLDRHWRNGAAFFIELPAIGDRHGA